MHPSDASQDEGEHVRKLITISFVLLVAVFAASAAYAVQPDEIMSDPAKETRARDLSRELRCMVCQNQAIDFLVARYGEFVLLKPRLKPHTLLLWLLPPLALAGGGFALWMHSRRRSRSAAAEDQSLVKLTSEEEARLQRLIAAEPPA